MFLHDSVKTDYFKNDRKLNLLKKGIINISQFVNLIEQKDEYILIGPAVVAKSAIKNFILEWKMKQLHLDAVKNEKYPKLSFEDLMNRLDDLQKVFPEITLIAREFKEQLKIAICPKCVKKQYFGLMVQKIKELKDDGRDLSLVKDFMDLLERKFAIDAVEESDEELLSSYDVEWIKPESLVGLGDDLIENLENCFECTIKHLGRAKILYEEFLTGYPDHKDLSFNEIDKGLKNIEQAYLIYLDSMSQLDMASAELIGNIIDLPSEWATDMIELANEIRQARLTCQTNANASPNFDDLRLKVKKLEIKTKKSLKEQDESETSSPDNK